MTERIYGLPELLKIMEKPVCIHHIPRHYDNEISRYMELEALSNYVDYKLLPAMLKLKKEITKRDLLFMIEKYQIRLYSKN